MTSLIEAISTRQPVVIWNPFKENDTLSKKEFISLLKVSGYKTVVYDGDWIIAYQKEIKIFGSETLDAHLQEAKEKQLYVYAFLLQSEMEQFSVQRREGI